MAKTLLHSPAFFNLFRPYISVATFNPFNAEAAFVQSTRTFLKPFKLWHVGIHWIALAEYSQMSTHVPVSHFLGFCTILYWPNLAASSIGVKVEILHSLVSFLIIQAIHLGYY